MTVRVAGDERAEANPGGDRRQSTEQCVGLEHEVLGITQHRQLVEVVHHEHRVETRGVGLDRLTGHGVEDGGGVTIGIGEVGDLVAEPGHGAHRTLGGVRLAELLPPVGADPLEVIDAFAIWAAEGARPLYPHQEEAALALAGGDHVVLATPTGSGKSLVATAGIALALNRGERAVWTAPIKALVAEKFFELVALLGAERVGLATGDATINADAPVLVCTAEVLAQHALATGASSPFGFACLDEFHFYGDPARGWAWQIPLLTLNRCQLLMASATLGDVSALAADLEARSSRPVTEVTSVHRPTPLHHQWRTTPVADSVRDAIADGLWPVYLVHSTQAAAIERAQALASLPLTTREQREAIAQALASERLRHGFGVVLARLLGHGVGVHHAGMLPRHRRLVERLASDGLLPVICGTDTLGIGVNLPIRTVILTALTKFDGQRVRRMNAREFHQLAGRAGRPGFDPDGHVWAQAPDHVIEQLRALAKAGEDPKARKRAGRAKVPEGFVHFDEDTFTRLIAARPEPLRSRFRVTADLVATILARDDGPTALFDLLATNHDPEADRRRHRRRALAVYRSLEAALVAERVRDETGRCIGVRIGALDETGERIGVRLSSPLATFALEVIDTLDPEDPDHVSDVVSVIEAILEDPRQILAAQLDAARAEAIAAMKADGVPYEERMARLDEVTAPRPLAEVLEQCFSTYRSQHPWVDAEPSPKSIVREMLEQGDTFATFVRRYRLERSEGLVLRYLADVWRTLDRSVPETAITEDLADVIEWLGAMIRAVDATLLEEWERLSGIESTVREEPSAPPAPTGAPPAWRTAMRTAVFGWVELLSRRAYGMLAERAGADAETIEAAMAPYWAEFDVIHVDGDARSRSMVDLVEEPDTWTLYQRLADPADSGEWRIVASMDVAASLEAGSPVLHLVGVEHLAA